jgi:hypothetical protein
MGIFFFLSVVEVKDIKVTLDKYLRDSEKRTPYNNVFASSGVDA